MNKSVSNQGAAAPTMRSGLRSKSTNIDSTNVPKKLTTRRKRKSDTQNDKENVQPAKQSRALRSTKLSQQKSTGENQSDAKQSTGETLSNEVDKKDEKIEMKSEESESVDYKGEKLTQLEIEVVEFLSGLRETRINHNEAHETQTQSAETTDVLNYSMEIPLVVYNNKTLSPSMVKSPVKKSPLKTIAQPNIFNISLNLSCHSDRTYDFANASPFQNLVEELDQNNNLVMRHPKLSTFVVSSDLNRQFGLTQIQTAESENVLRELQLLENNEVLNFKGITMCSSPKIPSYNWQVFKKLLDEQENDSNFGLSVCREAKIDLEQFTSPLLVEEEEVKMEQEQEVVENPSSIDAGNQEAKVEVPAPLPKKKRRRTKTAIEKKKVADPLEAKEFDYAYKKVQELFSDKELETGIFCELNKKGEPMNRSKIRKPLDEEKTYKLKMAIKKKFFSADKTDDKFDLCWSFLRKDLNKIIIPKK